VVVEEELNLEATKEAAEAEEAVAEEVEEAGWVDSWEDLAEPDSATSRDAFSTEVAEEVASEEEEEAEPIRAEEPIRLSPQRLPPTTTTADRAVEASTRRPPSRMRAAEEAGASSPLTFCSSYARSSGLTSLPSPLKGSDLFIFYCTY